MAVRPETRKSPEPQKPGDLQGEQQALGLTPAFVLPSVHAILSGRPKGAELREALMAHLLQAPEPSVCALDFSQVSFMDISCADELLDKLLLRVRSGELGARYLYLEGLNPSLRETAAAVLRLRGLSVLVRQEGRVELLGELKTPMREALDLLLARQRLTSAEMAAVLGKSVNLVCNRLNVLQRMGLACRLRDGSATGGGRQYCYVSLL